MFDMFSFCTWTSSIESYLSWWTQLTFSEEDDEIVECDNCGASVHEGKSVFIPHTTSWKGGGMFLSCQSVIQRVLFFVCTSPLKPQHRISENCIGNKDRMCR